MGRLFDAIARVISRHAHAALGALLLATVGLAIGVGMTGEQADETAFLPDGSEPAAALDAIEVAFPASAGLSPSTILFRGDEALTPTGLAQIDEALVAALAEPGVAERLALPDPVDTVTDIYRLATGVDDLSTLTQADVDAATAQIAEDPALSSAFDRMVGEAEGAGLVVSTIRLLEAGDLDGLYETEVAIADAVSAAKGPLDARAKSAGTAAAATADDNTMIFLMLGALGVIALLLLVFFRSGLDLALAMAGLAITVVGTLGAQGIMGPNGLGWIGDPNTITTMVPIILIGLVVDYAIQSVSHYREFRLAGEDVATSAFRGLRGVLLPLGLAATTTVISFLTNITSPIPANRDFGVVAAFGVFFGLAVMLTLVIASRAILDGRAEAKGKEKAVRPMSGAIPGAGKLIERIGSFVTAKPMVVLVVTGIATVVLLQASTDLNTVFDSNDFIADEPTLEDVKALQEAFGGQSELVTIYVTAELTDDRTLRNLLDLNAAFGDDLSRPTGAAGPITQSLGLLYQDWTTDSGEPDDNYDLELLDLADAADVGLGLEPVAVQTLLDRLQSNDPEGFAQVAVMNPDGPDETILRFSGLIGDQLRTEQMIEDIEGLWFGDRDQLTATSADIIGVEVTTAMTDSQTTSIIATIVAAVIVLMIFFWATEFKPMLAIIAVLPIGLVLIWVLGTMALTGIPYNVITALITALSIGIGVDYTIHIIHRFTEELERTGDVNESTKNTLHTTGSALVGSALTTALGFGVLLFSPLTPFQQFGMVTAITILFALFAAIAVVPPMLVVWAAYHQWRQAQPEHAPTPSDENAASAEEWI